MKFDWYYEPTTIEECIQLLNEYGPDAKLLAGGTDLVVRLRSRALKVKTVISLNSMPELGRFYKAEDGMHIGAMARLGDISKSDLFTSVWQVVKKGAGNVSSMQVRNVATLGGNTCNASPSADTVPGLIVADAVVTIAGPQGERSVSVEKFFVGPGKTVLQRGELVTSFKLPNFQSGNGAVYKKYAIRGDTDIAIIGVGGRIQLDAKGVVVEARLALGAVAATPLRITDIEKMLIGNVINEEFAIEVAQAAANACNPITDQRATKEYRKEMVRVWTKHVILEANELGKAGI
ncbi:FAD binding domain-containing protein [Desulfosporosinus fructosivorans]